MHLRVALARPYFGGDPIATHLREQHEFQLQHDAIQHQLSSAQRKAARINSMMQAMLAKITACFIFALINIAYRCIQACWIQYTEAASVLAAWPAMLLRHTSKLKERTDEMLTRLAASSNC